MNRFPASSTIAVAVPSASRSLVPTMCCPPGKTYGLWAQVHPGVWLRATAQRDIVNPLDCVMSPTDIYDVDFTGVFGDTRADLFAKRIYGFARHRASWSPLTEHLIGSYEYNENNGRCLSAFAKLGFLAHIEEEFHFTYGFLAEVLAHGKKLRPAA